MKFHNTNSQDVYGYAIIAHIRFSFEVNREQMDITIKHFKELTTTELYYILQLRSDVFVVEQHVIAPDCDNKDLDAYHLQIKEDGKLIGYCRILDKGVSYDSYSLGRVVISPSARGKKIGFLLIKEAIKFVEDHYGGDCITISAQAHLTDFYGLNGFVAISEPYIEESILHIKMQWNKNKGEK